jgi:hypothetical protein
MTAPWNGSESRNRRERTSEIPEAKVMAGERRDRTFDLYRSQLYRHLLPRLGQRRLGLITADDVVAVARELQADGLSPWTIKRILGALSCVFTFALRRGHIATHPFQRLERDERPHPLRSDQRVLTERELASSPVSGFVPPAPLRHGGCRTPPESAAAAAAQPRAPWRYVTRTRLTVFVSRLGNACNRFAGDFMGGTGLEPVTASLSSGFSDGDDLSLSPPFPAEMQFRGHHSRTFDDSP